MTIAKPSKPNPGCKIPDLPEIPNIESFLTVELPKVALEALIPKLEATKLLELAETIQGEVANFERMAKKRARTLQRLLEIPCPLPKVPDKGIDLSVSGLHDILDVEGGQLTLGESLLISQEEIDAAEGTS